MEQHRVMSWPHASEVVETWTVRHVMSAPVHIVAPAAGVKELVRTLREHGISDARNTALEPTNLLALVEVRQRR